MKRVFEKASDISQGAATLETVPYRRPPVLLTAILALAILLRVLAALFLGDRVEVLPGIHDQLSYDALARSIVAGKGYQFDTGWYPFTPANTPTAHWSFLYPLYLAVTYSVVGYHPLAARLVQAIVGGVLTCWVVYRLGRRIGGETVGLVAAAIAAVYAYFVYYSAALMTETFHIIAVLWALDLTLELADRATASAGVGVRLRNDVWLWLALGLALGIAVLQRQATLVVVPVLLLWLAWSCRFSIRKFLTGAVLTIAIVACLILPWTARNYRAFNQFLLLNSNAGFALYWSNHPQYGFGDELPTIEVGPVPPLPDEALGMNEAQIDRLLMQEAVDFILDDPVLFVRRAVGRVPAFFLFYPLAESSLISNLTRVLSFGLALPFMIFGLFLSHHDWRRIAVLYLFIGAYTLIHLASWPGARYRLPLDALLIPFAALAVVHLWDRLIGRRTRLVPEHGREPAR